MRGETETVFAQHSSLWYVNLTCFAS